MIEFLPKALSWFLKENPAVHVDVEARISAEIARDVQDGFADIGIAATVHQRPNSPLGRTALTTSRSSCPTDTRWQWRRLSILCRRSCRLVRVADRLQTQTRVCLPM
nr:hypothetical protein [Paraburkholderia panacisoli]